ncbi:MAG: RNA methyltransferase [Ignavibacterium sp.]|nr:MAG: RNA methyltransferase [Ignavibacterium sp.]
MITKNELKYYNSLLQKKFRKLENKFICEGKKVVLECLESSYQSEIIFITQKFLEKEEEYINNLKSFETRIVKLKSIDFRKVSDTRAPEGVAGVFFFENKKPDLSDISDPIIIYLEDISDPGNLGTIMRNCDWFGIKNIFLSPDSAEIYNPKVIRASTGSIFHINIFEEMLLDNILILKKSGYKFVCADIKGESVYNFKVPQQSILFLANESSGPSENLLSKSDEVISIPGRGKAESLNVSSASAILLSELTKQQISSCLTPTPN